MNSKSTFKESGINEDYIENIDEFKDNLLMTLECPICAGIVNNPVECKECQTIYCSECWNQLKISNKGCVMRCKKPVEKANKFVYGLLDKFLLKCPLCHEGGLSYQKFLLHYDCCIIANKYGTLEELTKLEKEKDEEIEKLKQDSRRLRGRPAVRRRRPRRPAPSPMLQFSCSYLWSVVILISIPSGRGS